MSEEKATPRWVWEYFGFSLAILSLVQAGIITEGLKPDTDHDHSYEPDWLRGFALAIRETQPERLERNRLTSEDVKRIEALRNDPKVQQLAHEMGLHQLLVI